jgi:hypothetical protein
MKIYLDVCCLNRPFDDSSQSRVRLEAEAVLSILEMGEAGELEIIDSDIIEDEISVMPDVERQAKVGSLLMRCVTRIPLTSAVERRGLKLTGWGISPMDALHLASAESARADVLLTTDDDTENS